jgi:hypothetical protein
MPKIYERALAIACPRLLLRDHNFGNSVERNAMLRIFASRNWRPNSGLLVSKSVGVAGVAERLPYNPGKTDIDRVQPAGLHDRRTPSHDQIVQHMGDDDGRRMVRVDAEFVRREMPWRRQRSCLRLL